MDAPVLRVYTFPQPDPQPPCQGGYTCVCAQCEAERATRLRRGVRRNRSHPVRKAA